MDSAIFDSLGQSLGKKRTPEAMAQLCAHLHETKDFASLFYALLVQKRLDLGVSPVPSQNWQAFRVLTIRYGSSC